MREGQPARLADVALRAGVSVATASRVLGGSRDRVSEALAARVLDAARAVDYVPNAHAKALVRASSTTLGLVVHDVGDPYFSEIARGVLRAAADRDRLVMICTTYRDAEREARYVAELRAQRVAAVLVAGSGYTDPEVEEPLARELLAFRAAGGRVALIGRHHVALDSVLPENTEGGAHVARHLIQRGHRAISVVSGPEQLTTTEDRLSGFRAELATHGCALRPADVWPGDFTREGGYRAARDLLQHGRTCTAIFALNDEMAFGVLGALRDAGVDAPAEVSVVGFDDIPHAVDVNPDLTTVRIEMAEMGATAVELALGAPGDDGGDGPRRVVAPTSLIARRSTATAPSNVVGEPA